MLLKTHKKWKRRIPNDDDDGGGGGYGAQSVIDVLLTNLLFVW